MRRCCTTTDEKQNAEASDALRFSQIILILSFFHLRKSAFSASSAFYF